MLRTNLSTRPFYNERAGLPGAGRGGARRGGAHGLQRRPARAVHAADRALGGRVGATEQQAARLREQAPARAAGVDRKQLEAVAAAAREANALIDERTFSWTELLNRLETTLPRRRADRVDPPAQQPGGPPGPARRRARAAAGGHRAFVEQLEKDAGFRHVSRGRRRPTRRPARGRAAGTVPGRSTGRAAVGARAPAGVRACCDAC